MGELIRTRYEHIMCKALEDLNIKYEIFQLFDFQCGQYFRWSKWEPPKLCIKCNTPLIPTQFARPAVVITSTDRKRVGVIRVYGVIKEKKRVKSNDYFKT